MRPSVKRRWIRALRSGKYNQVRNLLQNSYGHCCLGVLCDIIDPKGWDKKEWASDGTKNWKYKGESQSDGLPGALRGHLSISEDEEGKLVNMNDKQKMPFEGIADWIEVNL